MLVVINKKEVIIKESKKINKYLDLAGERKNQEYEDDDDSYWTVHKGLEKRLVELEIRGRTEAIQTIALLR